MRFTTIFCLFLLIALPFTCFSQGVGLNQSSPVSLLDINGNVTIGATYSGTNAAPTNGAIIEGSVGIGTSSPGAKLYVEDTGTEGYVAQFIRGNNVNDGGVMIRTNWPLGSVNTLAVEGFSGAPLLYVVASGSSGNVGIGTASPDAILHSYQVVNATFITGMLLENNGTITDGATSIQMRLETQNGPVDISNTASATVPGETELRVNMGGAVGPELFLTEDGVLSIDSKMIINEDGDDADTRIEGNTDVNLFYIEAGSNRVGIGTSSPAQKLDVLGNARLSNGGILELVTTEPQLRGYIQAHPTDVAGGGAGLIIATSTDEHISFKDGGLGGVENMTIRGTGNVGIGSTNPSARLNVVETVGDNIATFSELGDHLSYITIGSQFGTGRFGMYGNYPAIMTSVGERVILYDTNNDYNYLYTNDTERLIIDPSGNIGIGSTSPTVTLDINGPTAALALTSTTAGNGASIKVGVGGSGNRNGYINIIGDDTWTTYALRLHRSNGGANANSTISHRGTGILKINAEDAGSIRLYTQGATRMTINSAGNIGIGTTTPSSALAVCGTIKYTALTVGCSDRRYKENIVPMTNSLANLMKIEGVNFSWRTEEFPDEKFPKGTHFGFIAQDMENYYPEIVHTDDAGYKSIDYGKLTPVLLEAIKEQQAQIKEQHELIKALQDKVVKIEASITN